MKATRDGLFFLDVRAFQSVFDLVNYHIKTRKPLTAKSGVVLMTPVRHQEWELRHESITMSKKLGEGEQPERKTSTMYCCFLGAFGEVYKGSVKIGRKNIDVAIKTCHNLELTKVRAEFCAPYSQPGF